MLRWLFGICPEIVMVECYLLPSKEDLCLSSCTHTKGCRRSFCLTRSNSNVIPGYKGLPNVIYTHQDFSQSLI